MNALCFVNEEVCSECLMMRRLHTMGLVNDLYVVQLIDEFNPTNYNCIAFCCSRLPAMFWLLHIFMHI